MHWIQLMIQVTALENVAKIGSVASVVCSVRKCYKCKVKSRWATFSLTVLE